MASERKTLRTRLDDGLYCSEPVDGSVVYRRARYYDPTVGQFTSVDPFSGNAEDPQSLHKYAYVHGDPVNAIDPSGLFLEELLGFVGGFASAFTDFGAGLLNIGKSAYYGIGGFFDNGLAAQAALMHHQRIEIKNFAFWIASDPQTNAGKVLANVTKNVVGNLPKPVADRILKYGLIKFSGRVTGNATLNLSLRYVTNLAVGHLLAKAAAKSAAGRLYAGALSVGLVGGITTIQLLGIADQLAVQEERLQTKWPQYWRVMHAFHNSSYLYGVMPGEFDRLFQAMDTIQAFNRNVNAIKAFLKGQGV